MLFLGNYFNFIFNPSIELTPLGVTLPAQRWTIIYFLYAQGSIGIFSIHLEKWVGNLGWGKAYIRTFKFPSYHGAHICHQSQNSFELSKKGRPTKLLFFS
jgi:hypothetical protein